MIHGRRQSKPWPVTLANDLRRKPLTDVAKMIDRPVPRRSGVLAGIGR
jgi:hypothetical protein